MDRSLVFNNAGARALSHGHKAVALELFRGALETKLAFERQNPPGGTTHTEPVERCITPECVLRAESHLSHMDEYSTQNEVEELTPVLDSVDDAIIPFADRGYDPYVYALPFQLPSASASTQLTSAIIVFNLGLVHQIASRTSAKAAAFYEIAAALLASEAPSPESVVLRVAMLNNFGVWSYENGDGESLRTCMEHLSNVLQQARPSLDQQVEDSIKRNIDWLLTPPNGGSPAA
jgi:hypothetical protein